MATVEKEARAIRRKHYLQQALLTGLVIGGMIAIGAAPIGIPLGKRNKYRFKHQVKTAWVRLAQKGQITFVEKGGKRYANITPAGKKALEIEEQKKALQLQKRKRWDKRWRLVIFDIPERRRYTRDRLRIVMQGAGFYRLQDSVWVYPHDCEDFITLLKADLKIGWAVLYMIVEKIEGDEKLKEYFKLK
ncbi:MAG: hypothetical protein AAB919_00230 [Patescibacteria group bacterium]